MTGLRHFVLVEPFRKSDVSIFTDEGKAIRFFNAEQAAGKRVKLVSGTGTVSDLRSVLAALRKEMEA